MRELIKKPHKEKKEIRIKNKIFLASKKVFDVYKKLAHLNITRVGLFYGKVKKDGRLDLSLEAIYEISRLHKTKKAWVNKKAEQLFLYGRNVLPGSVIKTNAKKGELVVVLSESSEPLGLGKIMKDNEIKNIIDFGLYLRK